MTERYMVSAVPIDGGERVTGYYTVDGVGNARIDVVNSLGLWEESHIVDPDTIKPVRVKVKRDRTLVGDYRCPNCNAAFIDGMGTTPFCGGCGQALDWSDAP